MTRRGVLLVDDEPLSRQRIRQLLHGDPDFDVVGECGDARDLANVVRELRPDVVFLDIRMPYLDGFEAQQAIRSLVKHVVFVTAYPEHAARAFEVAASDYIVKPVNRDELIANQRGTGEWDGDFSPDYATAMALIVLQMPNRYLPVYAGKGPGS